MDQHFAQLYQILPVTSRTQNYQIAPITRGIDAILTEILDRLRLTNDGAKLAMHTGIFIE
jgi:hypothetical protein